MPPRVLFLDHTAARGGAELYLLPLAQAFRAHAQVVLFSDGPLLDDLRERGVQTHLLPAPAPFLNVRREGTAWDSVAALPSLMALSLRVARRARSYDLLFANSQKSFVVACLAGVLARRPVVWNLHDILSADHFGALNRWLVVRLANGCARRVIANSEATRQSFIDQGGRPDLVDVVYNGIDPAAFDAVAPSQSTLREAAGLSLPPNAFLIGVFSRLAAWKGQHVVLEALSRLPNVHVLLVGDALFGEDHEYARGLHEQARRLGIEERVHFLGFRSDVPALMTACDAVVHSSITPEPFGRVIVEGMLAGRPVVATHGGGASEIVRDGMNGRLVPPGQSDALAAVLRAWQNDPDCAEALVRVGAREARTRFGIEQQIEGVSRSLRSAV
jgi:glycosyltransferase involved in cell wall biosynthesis